jgi:hypothetical protein
MRVIAFTVGQPFERCLVRLNRENVVCAIDLPREHDQVPARRPQGKIVVIRVVSVVTALLSRFMNSVASCAGKGYKLRF